MTTDRCAGLQLTAQSMTLALFIRDSYTRSMPSHHNKNGLDKINECSLSNLSDNNYFTVENYIFSKNLIWKVKN